MSFARLSVVACLARIERVGYALRCGTESSRKVKDSDVKSALMRQGLMRGAHGREVRGPKGELAV